LEDQPSVAGVHRAESENVLKENAIGFGLFAVEHKMHAINHAQSVAPLSASGATLSLNPP
jgi:hypothetical protein